MIYTGIVVVIEGVHDNISGRDLGVSLPTVAVVVVQTRLLRMLLILYLASYLLCPIQAEITPLSSEKSKMVAMTMTMTVTVTVTVTVTNWWSKTHV